MPKTETATVPDYTLMNKATLDLVSGPIYRTWGTIAYDIEQCCAEQGEPMPNKAARMEVTCDANYMSSYGGATGKQADDVLSKLYELHGYEKVQKWLIRNINL